MHEGRRGEREESGGESSERHCFLDWGGQKIFPVQKVPRQCPLVFMMKVLLTEGRALESEGVVTGADERS
jgi:hypothetical protein